MQICKGSLGALVVPVFMLAFSLVYGFANRDVPASDMRLVTPTTIALIVICLVLIVKIMRHGPESRPIYSLAKLWRPCALLSSSLILLGGASYDFPIAAAAFLALSMLALGVRNLWVFAGVSMIIPIVLFLTFTWLGVPLNSFWLSL